MRGLRVLVACCDSGNRAALVDVVAQCGSDVLVAADVGEVRSVLAQQGVDLVFCDDGLPEGGFREVLRLTAMKRPSVHLVVSSLLGELDEYLEAMGLGAFDFVAPPYRRVEIESIVNSVRANSLSSGNKTTSRHAQAGAPHGGNQAAA